MGAGAQIIRRAAKDKVLIGAAVKGMRRVLRAVGEAFETTHKGRKVLIHRPNKKTMFSGESEGRSVGTGEVSAEKAMEVTIRGVTRKATTGRRGR